MLSFQLGQGTLGLQETEYYNNETAITEAYRQFMRDLAAELSNDTSAITNDVRDMFLLEKAIAQVIHSLHAFHSIIRHLHLVPLDCSRATSS